MILDKFVATDIPRFDAIGLSGCGKLVLFEQGAKFISSSTRETERVGENGYYMLPKINMM